MRSRWGLAAAAVLALVVVGAVGGLTMRAVAGVSHNKVVTKTVTKFCVYVDHTNPGDSYGDVTVLPKYKNRVCIAGKRGRAGDSSVVTWNKTIATAGAPPAARRKAGGSSGTVTLAHVWPFTVKGHCVSGEDVEAYTTVVSTENGSSLAWAYTSDPGSFDFGQEARVSNSAHGLPLAPDFQTEHGNGEFSVSTSDQKTAFTGFATNGVYIQGQGGPACSFTGYLVLEK
jgi:hypothetical protein